VTDPADPRLDPFRRLPERTARAGGRFVAESREVVRRMLDGGRYRPVALFATDEAFGELRDRLAALDPAPEIFIAESAVLREVAGYPFHRGCLALVERPPEPDTEHVLREVPAGAAHVLVVDDVADPDNVGALFRNAAAFGVAAVLLTDRSAEPLYRKAIRVSMGETLCLPWARAAAWPALATSLRANGFTLAALTPDGEDLERFATRAPDRLALVVGNEGAGLSPAARAACAAAVGIPMRAGADSLNVATAAAIALHRLTRDTPRTPH
jgi:tRNA G18 (ribose-2'-O)-methylase SpoU